MAEEDEAEVEVLVVDASLTWDSAELNQLLNNRPWTTVMVLLVDTAGYQMPALAWTNTEHRAPTVQLVAVPAQTDPYAYAAGYLHAKYEGCRPPPLIVVLTPHASAKPLRPLRHIRGLPVTVVRKTQKAQPEEQGDGEEEEEATPERTVMNSVMQMLSTESGQRLAMSLLQRAGGKAEREQ